MEKVIALLFENENIVASDSQKKKFLEITVSKLDGIVDEIFYTGKKNDFNFSVNLLDFKYSSELLAFFEEKFPDSTILILNAYSPLFDLEETKRMLFSHRKYFFDYTFSENLPKGLLPEIIETSVFRFIREAIPVNYPIFKESIKELFERNISSYDCNIHITDSELLKYRIDFIPTNFTSTHIIDNIINNNGFNLSIKDIENLIENNPLLIRVKPSYYEVELTTQRESGEMFISSRLNREGYIRIEDFKKILFEISNFSLNPVVSLGLFGEPFLHPDIFDIIEEIKGYPEINFIFESRALFNKLEPVVEALKLQNVKVIFDISFTGEENFKKYKSPLSVLPVFKKLSQIEQEVKSLPEKEKVYIQFTRSKINENELLSFFEKWREFTDRIIIKKLDTFCGLLDNMRVVDLSPVKRFFCYHLKNDFVIFYNGNVPLCREDYNGTFCMGNVLGESISEIWKRMEEFYLKHFTGNYSPELCKKCDEWWIFNF